MEPAELETALLACHDGSFVTTEEAGNIKLWRNGSCVVTLSGGSTRPLRNVPFAAIGCRLIVVGKRDNLLVAE